MGSYRTSGAGITLQRQVFLVEGCADLDSAIRSRLESDERFLRAVEEFGELYSAHSGNSLLSGLLEECELLGK